MASMNSRGPNSQRYHLAKTVFCLATALLLIVLGLQDLHGHGWAKLLIAVAILVATVMRWLVFREKR